MSARADRLEEMLDGAGVDALVVTDLFNVRYLTGYTGTNGIAIVGPDRRVFITDFRYVEQAAAEVDSSFDRVQVVQDLLRGVPDVLGEASLRLGFDDAHISVKAHATMREVLGPRRELVAAGGLVERLRVVKEPEEIERIASASSLADDAFRAMLEGGLIGRTELELGLALEYGMRERGAQAAGFPPIIAAASHGALPHAQPREVAITRGDLVVIDWGALLDGYCSDCTRTVAAGDVEPDAHDVYDIVLSAELAGVEATRAGIAGPVVDAVSRGIITEAGYGEHFGHGLGHGVGLEIHEAPTLSRSSEDVLQTGSVVTVEPGIYLTGRFGVRIEDLVVVGADGVEILTGVDKALIVCD